MEVILLGIYGFFVWLIFYKFKWLPMNFTAAVITITLPIVAMMALFLLLNIAAPATDDVRAMNYVIPIVPRITGQVTEVPIQPNRPIKKGDVLFKIDPVPFEAAVKAAEATLQGAKDQLNGSTWRKSASSNSRHSLQPGPGSGPILSRRKATSAISKASSSPPTPRNRRPERRSPSPRPTSSMPNSTSKAASTLLPPTVAWPTFPCNPACARPSSRQCP
jgi:multidrug efflux pump subunit AcrA (membrane-fusion protein)